MSQDELIAFSFWKYAKLISNEFDYGNKKLVEYLQQF